MRQYRMCALSSLGLEVASVEGEMNVRLEQRSHNSLLEDCHYRLHSSPYLLVPCLCLYIPLSLSKMAPVCTQ